MRNKIFVSVLLTFTGLLVAPAYAQNSGVINVKNEAFSEVAVPGTVMKKLVPATSAAPGETLVYVLTVRNISDKPASNVVVANPVPAYMEYQVDSQASGNARFDVSADHSKTYGNLGTLQKTATDGSQSIAQAKDITDLRWTFGTALKPKEETKITYRLRLN